MSEIPALPFSLEYGEYTAEDLWPNFLALAERGWPDSDIVAREALALKLSTTYAVLAGAVATGFVSRITFKVNDRVHLGVNRGDIE